jgi:hypothetical protein
VGVVAVDAGQLVAAVDVGLDDGGVGVEAHGLLLLGVGGWFPVDVLKIRPLRWGPTSGERRISCGIRGV